jgi:predicted nucleotidyltransferase
MTRREIEKDIAGITRQVVELVHPLRVVLFGSAAKGIAGEGSDLDFLVIIPEGAKPERIADILNTRVKRRRMPCDFLVITSSRLESLRNEPGLVYGSALEEGHELYAA